MALRFLIDAPLSVRVAEQLRVAGYHAVHVRELGLHREEDQQLVQFAINEHLIVVSADDDFGALLAQHRLEWPSFILFKRSSGRRWREQLGTLLTNVSILEEELEAGSIIVIEDQRIRIRKLPIT